MDKATAKRDDRTADPRAERANVLLKLLVEHYIEKGAPVSSKQLATESALKISSATVRNVMADLETMGLVTSPHTSAGKVPTAQGLRFFVDSLIQVQPLGSDALSLIQHELKTEQSPKELVSTASSSCPHYSHGWCGYAPGEITTLRWSSRFSRRARFSSSWSMTMKWKTVLSAALGPSSKQLQQAANFINSHRAGARRDAPALLASMEADKSRLNTLLTEMLQVAADAFDDGPLGQDGDYGGWEGNLLNFVSGDDMDTVGASTLSAASEMCCAFWIAASTPKSTPLLATSRVISLFGLLHGHRLHDVDGQAAGSSARPTCMAYQRVISWSMR